MVFEFRLFLRKITKESSDFSVRSYLGDVGEKAIEIFECLPGDWKNIPWEDRDDKYLRTKCSYVGIKKRGAHSKNFEVKLRTFRFPTNFPQNCWIENWTKYAFKANKLNVSETLNGLKELISSLTTQQGHASLPWECISTETMLLVRKRRRNLLLGTISLEICIIEAHLTEGEPSKWLSFAVESEREADILDFVSSSAAYPTSLLRLILQDSHCNDHSLLVGGYPLWINSLFDLNEGSGMQHAQEAREGLDGLRGVFDQCS